MSIIATACQSMSAHGFESFYRSLVEQFIADMPMTYSEFANRTGRATLPLTSVNDALFYSVAYAMSHYTAFTHVLADCIELEENDTIINIVDYGCGQGVATLAMMDFIASQKDPKTVHLNICLVEPSDISLGHACYKVLSMAEALGFNANITLQNCSLASAIVPSFNNGGDIFHLMSYIVDVPAVQAQLCHITDQIHAAQGKHMIVATAPNYPDAWSGFKQLSQLAIGKSNAYYDYHVSHRSYRVTQGCYQTISAKVLDTVLEVDNCHSPMAHIA